MLVELTSDKQAQLDKWFKVRSINGKPVEGIHVRFGMARDSNGNILPTIPATDTPIYVELEYNSNGYP